MDKADEEFYVSRAKMLREYIDTRGIPLEEKRSLWYSTYMLAQNYELQKHVGTTTENIHRLADAFGGIGYTCIEAGKANERVQHSAHIARINQQITDAKQKSTLRTIKKDTELCKGIEKNLGKVDSRMTADLILKQVKRGN